MASTPPDNNPGYISIPLGRTTWKRTAAKEPEVFLINRYFESTPTSLEDQVSMPLRPTLVRRTSVGEGPIRAVYQQDGVFNGDLFVVSGTGVYRVSKASDGVSPDTVTQITGEARGDGTPYMVAAYVTGGTAYLWLADGFSLQYYAEGTASASGVLTFTAQPANNDTFTIGTTTYTFKTSASLTLDVQIGADLATSISNAVTKIGANSTDVTVTAHDGTTITVTAVTSGTSGNTIATTDTGATMSWSGSTLFGGRSGTSLATVPLPDDVSATSLDYIKGFVIVTVGEPFAQRFYWIEPGAASVDALNFAEAESSLDPVLYVKTIGDQFWLFGPDSTEPWYVTGDPTNVMAPIQGRPFSRGIWAGTAIKVNDSVILVGKDARVYDVSSGPDPVSYPGVEEKIRRGMRIQLYGDFA